MLNDGQDGHVSIRKSIVKIYKCKKCGLPKKDHTCTGVRLQPVKDTSQNDISQTQASLQPPTSLFVHLPTITFRIQQQMKQQKEKIICEDKLYIRMTKFLLRKQTMRYY